MFRKKQPTIPGRVRPTITGERQNASVFSYHANRSGTAYPTGGRRSEEERSKIDNRPRAPRQFKRVSRIVVLIVALALVVLNLIVTTHPEMLTVSKAAPGQLFLQSQSVYTAAATQILEDSWLNRTKLTINTTAIAKQLSNQYPELGTVTVSVPFIGQRPVFYLEPATPAVLLATKTGEVFVLDVNGKALAPLVGSPGISKLKLPTVLDNSGLSITPGAIALPSTHIAFILEITGQLKAKHLQIQSLTLPPGTSELQVKVSEAPYTIRFNLHGDARAEVGAFLAVKKQLDAEKKVPGEYIDVRVEGRAYYK